MSDLSPLKKIVITGALLGALSVPALSIMAQEATPEAIPDVSTEAAGEAAGFLGVQIADQDDGTVVVLSVVEGSPAEAAGLLHGDLITAVNGEAVASAQDVVDAISSLPAGETIALTIDRAGETVEAEAVLAAQADFAEAASSTTRGSRFGLRLMDRLGLSYDSETGAYTIDELADDSDLYIDGLRSGDEITAIDGEAYEPAALLAYIGTLGSDAEIVLEVERDGETVELTIPSVHLIAIAVPGMGLNGDVRGQHLNGYLGVSFLTLDETVAAEQGVTLTEGALVQEVAAGSPAETAGLQAGDVITAVNGEAVDAEHSLRDRLSAYEAGDVLTLTIVRGDAEQQLEATLGEASGSGSAFPGRGGSGRGQGGSGRGGSRGSGGPGSSAQATPEVTPEVTPEATVEPGASA